MCSTVNKMPYHNYGYKKKSYGYKKKSNYGRRRW